jgi:predicted RNA binding protein YcfA (HicA-like mRNA interferase family)
VETGMGAPLPVISGREAAKAFQKLGWNFLTQRSSHMIYGKERVPVNLSIPDHKTLDRGMLRSLIRKAGISVEEFLEALER